MTLGYFLVTGELQCDKKRHLKNNSPHAIAPSYMQAQVIISIQIYKKNIELLPYPDKIFTPVKKGCLLKHHTAP